MIGHDVSIGYITTHDVLKRNTSLYTIYRSDTSLYTIYQNVIHKVIDISIKYITMYDVPECVCDVSGR